VTQKELCSIGQIDGGRFSGSFRDDVAGDEKRNNWFCGLDFLSEAKADALSPKRRCDKRDHCSTNHPEPVDIDSSKEKWAVTLNYVTRTNFTKMETVSACVGCQRRILGLMILGDRSAAAFFTTGL